MERHYYGGEPFDVIAADLGISKSWASRLHERAILAVKVADEPRRRGAEPTRAARRPGATPLPASPSRPAPRAPRPW